jgi:hypothetical protein
MQERDREGERERGREDHGVRFSAISEILICKREKECSVHQKFQLKARKAFG